MLEITHSFGRRPVLLFRGLFDGDAFGEIAGFVYVDVSEDGDVVGQELQGDGEGYG